MAGRRAIDMLGFETENARVVGRVSVQPGGRALWALECVCGKVFRAAGSDIRRRPKMSCGCRGLRPKPKDAARKPNGFVGAFGEAHPTFKNAQTEGQRGYNRTHRYLARTHGRAADHPCAEGCGDMAEHWSYDGYCPEERFGNATNDGKPWCPHMHHYQPRCASCHKGWDADQDYVAEAS